MDIRSPHDHRSEIEALDNLALLLDSRWRIPGTNVRLGVDAVIGLIPGLGDAASGIVSAYLVYRVAQIGAPKLLVWQMAGNVALDTVVGSVPILGSVFDVFFKANRRNIRLLRNHLDRQREYLPQDAAGVAPQAGQ
jgi:hypothetical protein